MVLDRKDVEQLAVIEKHRVVANDDNRYSPSKTSKIQAQLNRQVICKPPSTPGNQDLGAFIRPLKPTGNVQL